MVNTKFLRGFNSDVVWIHDSRQIRVEQNGEIIEVNMDEYAKEHGIELPDAKKSKKQINKDIEVKHGDMESSQHSGDTEEHGDGNSESTE